MNYVYMSTCMKALCRHVKQNKQQGEGDRYHTAHPHHTTEGGRDSTTPGSTTVLWLTHDHGRGGWNAGPYIGVWGVFSLIRRNQPADWIFFIVARRSLDWFLDAMADVQDHCTLAQSTFLGRSKPSGVIKHDREISDQWRFIVYIAGKIIEWMTFRCYSLIARG